MNWVNLFFIVPKIGSMYTHIDFIFIYIYWITDILDLNIGSEYGSMNLVKFIGKNSWRLLIPKNQTWPLWGTHMFIHLCWGKRPFFLIGTKLCPLQRGATRSLCCERTAQHLTLPLSRKKAVVIWEWNAHRVSLPVVEHCPVPKDP